MRKEFENLTWDFSGKDYFFFFFSDQILRKKNEWMNKKFIFLIDEANFEADQYN